MSMPLSPRSPESLNRHTATLSIDQTVKEQNDRLAADGENSSSCEDRTPSSPFQTEVDQENKLPFLHDSPSQTVKAKDSPTKTFTIHDETNFEYQDSIEKTSPYKVQLQERQQPCNEGSSRSPLKGAAEWSPSKLSPSKIPDMKPSKRSPLPDSPSRKEDDEHSELDMRSVVSEDTCFSTFSAVPNVDMTQFASLRSRVDDPNQSPVRGQRNDLTIHTPGASVYGTPRTSHRNRDGGQSRSPSPTPRGQRTTHAEGDTTNLLLDFTQRFGDSSRSTSRSPRKNNGLSPTKSVTESNLLAHLNNQRRPSPTKAQPSTPGGTKRTMLNLLDFDLPPQPTPRSIPTITVRELESLKSTYLSEISSLKASLSGREAEVESLKKAVTDAERRVGEAHETLRDEKNAREHAEMEKSEWEKKGKELEAVLKTVREEYINEEREKDELVQKLEESNRAKEEAELRAAQLSTRADVAQSEAGDSPSTDTSPTEAIVARRVAEQLDEKMENLARELHGVYKKKHEAKVTTLKKTYEARSEKKLSELQRKIDELTKHNEELLANKDATFSGTLPSNIGTSAEESTDVQQLKEQRAEIEGQKAKIAGLTEEMKTLQSDHAQLMEELENERVEKGELVAAVDEMLALQSETNASNAVDELKRSVGRPSGLKGPGFGESRIGKASGLPSFGAGKSKMMSNIERMGSGRSAE